MREPAGNDEIRRQPCVQCGQVDPPINIWPGPGWLVILLWGASAAGWTLGMATGSLVVGYVTAAIFLATLIYTLWYFYRREKACRHCGTRWTHPPAGSATP